MLALATGVGVGARVLFAAEPADVEAAASAPPIRTPPIRTDAVRTDAAESPPTEVAAPVPSRPAAAATAGVSMDQAVKIAEQRFKARVVRADTEHDGAKLIYVLKLLNEAGQVWTVRVDAENGAIL